MKAATIRWIALLAMTLIAIYLCWQIVQPFVQVFLWATVLAMLAYPAHRWLRRRGWGRNQSAMLVTTSVILIVLIPLSLMGLALAREAAAAAPGVEAFIRHALDPNSSTMSWLGRYVDVSDLLDPSALAQRLNEWRSVILNWMLNTVGGFLGILAQVFFVIFTLFYMLRDADRILPAVREMIPLESAQADAVLKRTAEVISASLQGVVLIAAIQAVLGGIAFWALGLPSPLLWSVVMFLTALIPMAGTFIVWVPAAVYLAVSGHWIKALLLTAWGLGVIAMADNLLRPKLVGQKTKLHELVVFFSVLGGLQVFGILGLVVGPVVVAITVSLIDVLRQAGTTETG